MSASQWQNEQVLTALLDMTPELILLVDPACRIVMFNTACENLTGYSRQEALGRDPFDFLIPPQWARKVLEPFFDPLSPNVTSPTENTWLTKSGEERLIRWQCNALWLTESKQPYILGIGTDVSEQTAREISIRKDVRLLELFFDSTLSCEVILDKDFNFIRVNEAYAKACQRDISDFTGRNYFDLYPSDAKAIFEEVVTTRQTFSDRARPFRFPDDPERALTYWDWALVPVLDEGGDVELLLLSLNKVTQQRQAEMDLRAMADRLRNLSRQMVEIQENERRHLARELHDEIGQELTAVKLQLENCVECFEGSSRARLHNAMATLNELTVRVRQISLNLRPPMLDDLGLVHALLGLIDLHHARTGLEISFRHSGFKERAHPDIEIAAYRIVQEATNNIARHSGVFKAEVVARGTSEAIMLRIEDRGSGFDWQVVSKNDNSHGLAGMQERARLLGGRVSIETASGSGTTIIAELPLRHPKTVESGGNA